MQHRNLKFSLFILILLAAAATIFFFDFKHLLHPTTIRDFVAQFDQLAPLVYILTYILLQLVLFPTATLSIAGGLLFGTVYGTIYAIIGAVIGPIIAFTIARVLGQDYFREVVEKKYKSLEHLDEHLKKEGFFAVLFFRLPLFPRNLMSYIFGITSVPLWMFVLATTIMAIIITPFLAHFGNSLAELNLIKIITSTIIILMAIIIFPIIERKYALEHNIISKKQPNKQSKRKKQ